MIKIEGLDKLTAEMDKLEADREDFLRRFFINSGIKAQYYQGTMRKSDIEGWYGCQNANQIMGSYDIVLVCLSCGSKVEYEAKSQSDLRQFLDKQYHLQRKEYSQFLCDRFVCNECYYRNVIENKEKTMSIDLDDPKWLENFTETEKMTIDFCVQYNETKPYQLGNALTRFVVAKLSRLLYSEWTKGENNESFLP